MLDALGRYAEALNGYASARVDADPQLLALVDDASAGCAARAAVDPGTPANR